MGPDQDGADYLRPPLQRGDFQLFFAVEFSNVLFIIILLFYLCDIMLLKEENEFHFYGFSIPLTCQDRDNSQQLTVSPEPRIVPYT